MGELWAGPPTARRRVGTLPLKSDTKKLVSGQDDRGTSFAYALLGLLLGSYLLSKRYYTSAAFERAYHLSFFALVIHAALLRLLQPWIAQETRRIAVKGNGYSLPITEAFEERKNGGPMTPSLFGSFKDPMRASTLWLLSAGVAVRCILLWYLTQTSQCTSIGLESFRGLYVYALDSGRVSQRILGGPFSPGSTYADWPRWKAATFLKFALSWAWATMKSLDSARIPTSAICPRAWWYFPDTPVPQITACALDAFVLIGLSNMRQKYIQQGRNYASTLMSISLLGAASVVLLSITSWSVDRNFFWALTFRWADIRDLLVDGSLAAVVMLCGFHLLAVLSPSTVAFAVTGMTLYGVHIPYLGIGAIIPPLNMEAIQMKMAIAAFSVIPMLLLLRPPLGNPRPAVTALVHHWLLLCYGGIIALCLCFCLLGKPASVPHWSVADAVGELTRSSRSYSTSWQAQAAGSASLEDAVAAYSRRYGIPPPPNFDKWYNYAMEHKSPIIDDFEQIQSDLLPFWGIAPAEIRERTHEIQRYAEVEMVGLRIRDGRVDKSPYIHPSHQWMLDSVERMVKPFAQWLPDMDIAINVADEPRVALAHEERQYLETQASYAHERLRQHATSEDVDLTPPTQWPSDFPKPTGTDGQLPEGFTSYIRKPILYDLVAESCAPGSPLYSSRWWDHSTACTHCQLPHSLITKSGSLVLNASLSSNLCHQPDLAYLAGSVLSPSAMFATRQLSPVFSQGRLGGFSDILMPSPWNFDELSKYDDMEDIEWSAKANSIFWRGGSTDGYAAEGSWIGFTRARFVHEAFEHSKSLKQGEASSGGLGVNVSFSGDLSRCHDADCRAELETFNEWAASSAGIDASLSSNQKLPPPLPFSTHWRFRHLIDMDGAGFSGRFLPFLLSRSLVYRAALYRTWMDERVHAWRHYIPVDVRLGDGFWSLLKYLSGKGDKGSGDQVARDIADQGRRWASRALRKEDMQIYMFRLLLEWGRVVSDDREQLFYSS